MEEAKLGHEREELVHNETELHDVELACREQTSEGCETICDGDADWFDTRQSRGEESLRSDVQRTDVSVHQT